MEPCTCCNWDDDDWDWDDNWDEDEDDADDDEDDADDDEDDADDDEDDVPVRRGAFEAAPRAIDQRSGR
jgi:hypothetical protein